MTNTTNTTSYPHTFSGVVDLLIPNLIVHPTDTKQVVAEQIATTYENQPQAKINHMISLAIAKTKELKPQAIEFGYIKYQRQQQLIHVIVSFLERENEVK